MPATIRSYLLAALAPLFWSSNFILGRALHQTIPPIALSFWRWTLALALVLPFALPRLRHQWGLVRRHWRVLSLLAVLGVTSFNTLVYIGLQTTTATNAVLMVSATPVLIVLLSQLLLRQITGPPVDVRDGLSPQAAMRLGNTAPLTSVYERQSGSAAVKFAAEQPSPPAHVSCARRNKCQLVSGWAVAGPYADPLVTAVLPIAPMIATIITKHRSRFLPSADLSPAESPAWLMGYGACPPAKRIQSPFADGPKGPTSYCQHPGAFRCDASVPNAESRPPRFGV